MFLVSKLTPNNPHIFIQFKDPLLMNRIRQWSLGDEVIKVDFALCWMSPVRDHLPCCETLYRDTYFEDLRLPANSQQGTETFWDPVSSSLKRILQPQLSLKVTEVLANGLTTTS